MQARAEAPPAKGRKRALISTLAGAGGVNAMWRAIAGMLSRGGYTPVIAYYEPYRSTPAFSVPSFRLLQRRPGSAERNGEGFETHAIGAWLPELEFTHYLVTDHWKRVIESADVHLTVSGAALPALPYYWSDQPFLAWLATGWKEDRDSRIGQFSLGRRMFHAAFVEPPVLRLERSVLRRGSILSLSEHTQRVLDGIAGAPVVKDVLPQPVDSTFFAPRRDACIKARIGFSGRLDDARKNVGLLVDALGLLAKRGHDVTAMLIGGEPDAALSRRLASLGIGDRVTFCPFLPPEGLRERLQTLDLYVVPSLQEGLCIAAIEAMAVGLPVVSTRCGGPEDYVIDDETGRLVDFDAEELADAIIAIVGNRALRDRLSAGARDMALTRYSLKRAESVFWSAFGATFERQPA